MPATKLDAEEVQALNLWLHTLCAEQIGPSAPFTVPRVRATWQISDISRALETVSQELGDEFAMFFAHDGVSDIFWKEMQATKPHLIMAAMKAGAATYIGGSV